MEVTLDVDRLPNGDTIIASTPVISQTPLAGMPGVNFYRSEMHQIYTVSENKQIHWRYSGLGFPHEVEPVNIISEDYFFIADTDNDAIKQINSTFDIVWQFQIELFDWSQVNSSWDETSYYNNPIEDDWTHVNDVDFINGSQYDMSFDSLLISIRNFDLIILLNYTAEYQELQLGDPFASVENVYWWYGPGIINHQHNPDILTNGNIVICDSVNDRIIEVNRSTKEIEFELKNAGGIDFSWPRDADYIEIRDTFLVTDSANNRIVEVTRTGDILWQWTQDLALPYESDILENGNILISGGASGVILEINYLDNSIVWVFYANYGKDFFILTLAVNTSYIFLVSIISLTQQAKKLIEMKRSKYIIRPNKWIKFAVVCAIVVLMTIILIFTKELVYSSFYPMLVIVMLMK